VATPNFSKLLSVYELSEYLPHFHFPCFPRRIGHGIFAVSCTYATWQPEETRKLRKRENKEDKRLEDGGRYGNRKENTT
jgi:hypothetical protein